MGIFCIVVWIVVSLMLAFMLIAYCSSLSQHHNLYIGPEDKLNYVLGSMVCILMSFLWPAILPLALCVVLLAIPISYAVKLGNNFSEIKKEWLNKIKEKMVEGLEE